MTKPKTTKPKATPKTVETVPPDTTFDPATLVVEHGGHPRAPRLTVAWEAIQAVLADGKVHSFEDLMAVSDLAENSVRSLLASAISTGKVRAIYDDRQARRTGAGRPSRKYRLSR